MLYSNVRLMVNLIKRKDEGVWQIVSWSKLLADVAFFGLFIFLMIWEANNRQLYNALPVLVLSLFAGFAVKDKRKTPDKE